MRAAEALAVAGLVLGAPAAARGDGAFPAGEGVLVPADDLEEVVLVTNFGSCRPRTAGQPGPGRVSRTRTRSAPSTSGDRHRGGGCSRSRTSTSSIPTMRPAAGRRPAGFSPARRSATCSPIRRTPTAWLRSASPMRHRVGVRIGGRRRDLRRDALPGIGRRHRQQRRDRAVGSPRRLPGADRPGSASEAGSHQ